MIPGGKSIPKGDNTMDHQEAFARVEREQEYIVEVLRRIIAVDTSVPPGENYAQLIDILQPELQRFGFEAQRVVVPEDKVAEIPATLSGERPNLVAALKNGKPEVSLYAHMDVVPADDSWTVDPFAAVVEDGRVYGRGTVDDKGPMACVLGAVKVIHDLGLEPNFDIHCLFCTDEEVGHYPGARYLAEEGYFSDHIIWMDLGAVDPIFIHGAAGTLSIDLTGVGRSCHSGMNYLGVNAIEEMVPILNELMALKAVVEQRRSRIPAFPDPRNPSNTMTPMFNLAIVNGGTKDNIVPAECRLTINRRYIDEESLEEVVSEIRAAVEKGRKQTKLLDLGWDVRHDYGPVAFDPHTPALDKWLKAIKAARGYEQLIFGGIGGSTDLGFVLDALKPRKPSVLTAGVARASDIRAHGADEFVYIEDLVSFTKQLVHYFAF
jgi:succinyl-diaminopimelate desuccinylase